MDIEKIDFSKIYLTCIKNGYRFAYEGKSFKIQGPICESPFGVELYNNKEIVNLHFNKLIAGDDGVMGNKINNFLVYFRIIEKVYEQFNNKHLDKTNLPFINLPNGFLKDISNHQFMSLLRAGIKDGSLLRTHLQKNTKFYKIENEQKVECLKSELKGKKCIPIFDIASIWKYGKKYGLLVYIDEIIII